MGVGLKGVILGGYIGEHNRLGVLSLVPFKASHVENHVNSSRLLVC